MKSLSLITLATIITAAGFCQVSPVKKATVINATQTPAVTQKKKPLVVSTQKVKLEQPLKITSHSDGQEAYGAIQLLGTGTPGETVTVKLYAFAEVTPKKKSPWETFKKIVLPPSSYNAVNAALKQNAGTQIKERFFKTYTATIDENGKWYIPVFQSFGSPDWMRQAFIPFAWVVSAATTDNPNYREGNTVSIRLGCKM